MVGRKLYGFEVKVVVVVVGCGFEMLTLIWMVSTMVEWSGGRGEVREIHSSLWLVNCIIVIS